MKPFFESGSFGPMYELYRDVPMRNALIVEYWKIYEPYAEKDYLSVMKAQSQEHFFGHLWEMQLTVKLKRQGLDVSTVKGNGPDVTITLSDGRKIWIEAVTCTDGIPGLPDSCPPRVSGQAASIDTNKVLLRFRTALQDKIATFKRYIEKGIVSPTDICVIALNSSSMANGYDWEIPLIAKAVYPIGSLQYNIPIGPGSENKSITVNHQYQPKLFKINGASVSKDIFLSGENNHISAVIGSQHGLINDTMDVVSWAIAHNHTATNPLPYSSIKATHEFIVEQDISNVYFRDILKMGLPKTKKKQIFFPASSKFMAEYANSKLKQIPEYENDHILEQLLKQNILSYGQGQIYLQGPEWTLSVDVPV